MFHSPVQKKMFPERIGIVNVEGGCATGSMAFHGAWKDVISGTEDVSLAIGVRKFISQIDQKKFKKYMMEALISLIEMNG